MDPSAAEAGITTTIDFSSNRLLPKPENETQAASIIYRYTSEKVQQLAGNEIVQRTLGNLDIADKLKDQVDQHMAMMGAAINGDPKSLRDYVQENDIQPLLERNANLAQERDALPDDERYNQLQEELQLTQLRRDSPQANPALAAIDARIYGRIQNALHNQTSKGIKDRDIAYNQGIIAEYQRVIDAANSLATPAAETTKIAA
jgi:hypothetical protein